MPRKGQSGTVRAWLSEHLISVVRKTGLVFPIRRRAPSWWYSFEIRPVGLRTGRSDGSSGMTKGLGSAGGYTAKFRPLRCFLLHIARSGRLGRELGRDGLGAAVLSGVPMVDGRGLGLLGLVLIGLAIRGLRSSATLALMVLVSFVGAADLSSRPRAAGSLRLWPPGRGFEDSPRGASGSPRPARRLALSNLASRAN